MSTSDKELEAVGNFIFSVLKGFFDFFKNVFIGCRRLKEKRSNFVALAIFLVAGAIIFLLKDRIWQAVPIDKVKYAPAKYLLWLSLGLPLLYLYWKGDEYTRFIREFDLKFDSIGFFSKGKVKKRNLAGEVIEIKDYPKFMREEKDGKQTIYYFYSSIPLPEWKSKVVELETVLDCNITKIVLARNTKKVIKLYTIPSSQGLKDYVPWSNDCIREKDFEVTVGVAMLDDVVFDLNKVPHGLIAGVTGSGKSVLLRCILWQSIKKGAKIYMFDFKGGVEFGLEYEQFGEVVTDRIRALAIFKELVKENALRLALFRQKGVKNLAEYNALGEMQLCRVVVFCDEVAEMLDKTGLSKQEKKIYEEIEKEMSSLARLSRAAGINMILGTQRPDAKVITGQIKNNLPIRISGRMVDAAASEMVLNNTKATLLDETRGRFMYNIGADTWEFQAYHFEDKFLVPGNYVVGDMLISQLSEDAKGELEKGLEEIEENDDEEEYETF